MERSRMLTQENSRELNVSSEHLIVLGGGGTGEGYIGLAFGKGWPVWQPR